MNRSAKRNGFHGRYPFGFALVEVLIAIVIIAVGLVFIFQSFSTSADALKISKQYFAAADILDSVANELEQGRLSVDSIRDSTVTFEETQYTLSADPPRSSKFTSMGLQEVFITIRWNEDKRGFGLSVLTRQ